MDWETRNCWRDIGKETETSLPLIEIELVMGSILGGEAGRLQHWNVMKEGLSGKPGEEDGVRSWAMRYE